MGRTKATSRIFLSLAEEGLPFGYSAGTMPQALTYYLPLGGKVSAWSFAVLLVTSRDVTPDVIGPLSSIKAVPWRLLFCLSHHNNVT